MPILQISRTADWFARHLFWFPSFLELASCTFGIDSTAGDGIYRGPPLLKRAAVVKSRQTFASSSADFLPFNWTIHIQRPLVLSAVLSCASNGSRRCPHPSVLSFPAAPWSPRTRKQGGEPSMPSMCSTFLEPHLLSAHTYESFKFAPPARGLFRLSQSWSLAKRVLDRTSGYFTLGTPAARLEVALTDSPYDTRRQPSAISLAIRIALERRNVG